MKGKDNDFDLILLWKFNDKVKLFLILVFF